MFSQSINETLSFIRLNGSTSFVTHSVHGLTRKHDWKSGYSIEIGGKSFINNSRYFIEGSAHFYDSYMSYADHDVLYYEDSNESKELVEVDWFPARDDDKLRENGIGATCVGGYDFSLNDNMSLEVFTGLTFRYLLNVTPHYGYSSLLHKAHIKLRVGAALNIDRFSVNLSLNQDIMNRAKSPWLNHSCTISLGVAYRFKFFYL